MVSYSKSVSRYGFSSGRGRSEIGSTGGGEGLGVAVVDDDCGGGFEEVVEARKMVVSGTEGLPGGGWLAVGHGTTWRAPNFVRMFSVECNASGASSLIVESEPSAASGIL